MSEESKNSVNDLPKDSEKNKKKTKKSDLVEKYNYIPEDGDELIIDTPSESLNLNTDIVEDKKDSKKQISKESKSSQNMNNKVKERVRNIKEYEIKEIKSNKELYESYVKELDNFILVLNNDTIYDSSIDKSKNYSLIFENDYFVLYGRKYSYNGLKIQKISKR